MDYGTYAVGRADLGEAYRQYALDEAGFAAEEVLPVRVVKKKAATLSVLRRENLKRVDARHSNGSVFNRIGLTLEDLAYACVDFGLEKPLTDEDRENYVDDFDAELETIATLTHSLKMEQEIRTAADVFNTTTWTGADLFTDNKATPWSTTSTDVIAQLIAAKGLVRGNTGMEPDSLLVSAVAFDRLLMNDDIRGLFPGSKVITEALIRANLAAILGLQNLIVGRKLYDSAAEGQDFSGSYVWSDAYAMVFRKSQGSLSQGGLGRTLRWGAMSNENVEVYREPQTIADVFRVRHYQDEKIFDPYFGHLLQIETV